MHLHVSRPTATPSVALRVVLRLMFGAWLGGVSATQVVSTWQAGAYLPLVLWLGATWALGALLLVTLHHLVVTEQVTR